MAVGTISFPQQLNQGFNPLSPVNGMAAPMANRGGDQFTGSDALKDAVNPLAASQGANFAQNLGGSMMDGILKSQAVQVVQGLQTGQGDPKSAVQSLLNDYQKAKQGNLPISPKTEELVQQALQMAQQAGLLDPQQQQGQQAGGAPPVGAPQGGGGAPQGGGGAPQGGGGAPQGGGGAPQGGGSAPQGGGGTPQSGGTSSPSEPARVQRSAPAGQTGDQPSADPSAAATESAANNSAAPNNSVAPTQSPATTETPGPAPVNPNSPSATTNPPAPATAPIGTPSPVAAVNETPAGERLADAAPATPSQSINQFGQTTPNNCSSIAVIKQMRAQWGRDAMHVQRSENGGVNVTMRDDYQVELSREQLRQARDGSDFQGQGRGANNAVIYQAAAAQRMASESNGSISYQDALGRLNTNQFPQEIARYYGVGTQEVNPRTLQAADGTQHASAIGYDNAAGNRADDRQTANHTAMIARRGDGSMVYDHYGQQQPYNGRITNSNGVTGDVDRAFVLTDRNPRPGGGVDRNWANRASQAIGTFTTEGAAPAAGRQSDSGSLAANTTRPTGTAPGSTGGTSKPSTVSKPSSGSSSKGSSGGSTGGGSTKTKTSTKSSSTSSTKKTSSTK